MDYDISAQPVCLTSVRQTLVLFLALSQRPASVGYGDGIGDDETGRQHKPTKSRSAIGPCRHCKHTANTRIAERCRHSTSRAAQRGVAGHIQPYPPCRHRVGTPSPSVYRLRRDGAWTAGPDDSGNDWDVMRTGCSVPGRGAHAAMRTHKPGRRGSGVAINDIGAIPKKEILSQKSV